MSIDDIVARAKELLDQEPGYRALYIRLTMQTTERNAVIKQQYMSMIQRGVCPKTIVKNIRKFWVLERGELRNIIKNNS